MADSLDGLRNSLSDIARSINETLNRRQGYMNKAAEIRAVYDRLAADKRTIKEYRKSVKTYSSKSFDEFKGNNKTYVYKPEMTNLLDAYDIVIRNIDHNLDALNDEILRQNNLASDCLGPLGYLESAYNTVKTKIENWVN